MLKVNKETKRNVIILEIEGQLNALTAGEFKPVIKELFEDKHSSFVFDFNKLNLIDSSGVGAVVSVFKRARADGGDAKIANLSSQPKEVFDIFRLSEVIDVYPSVTQAVDSFEKTKHSKLTPKFIPKFHSKLHPSN